MKGTQSKSGIGFNIGWPQSTTQPVKPVTNWFLQYGYKCTQIESAESKSDIGFDIGWLQSTTQPVKPVTDQFLQYGYQIHPNWGYWVQILH